MYRCLFSGIRSLVQGVLGDLRSDHSCVVECCIHAVVGSKRITLDVPCDASPTAAVGDGDFPGQAYYAPPNPSGHKRYLYLVGL